MNRLQEALASQNEIFHLKELMTPGVHYGPPYPGSKKDTLHKPGAELIKKYFKLRVEYHIRARKVTSRFVYYEVEAQCFDRETGEYMGNMYATASSGEEKYAWRWVSQEEVPPDLDLAHLPRRDGTRTEFKSSVDNAAKGKPNLSWRPQPYWDEWLAALKDNKVRETTKKAGDRVSPAYEMGTILYRVPSNAFDIANTLMKMAEKRALVSLMLDVTGASSYFSPGDMDVDAAYVLDEDEIEQVDKLNDAILAELSSDNNNVTEKPGNSQPGTIEKPVQTITIVEKDPPPPAPKKEEPKPPVRTMDDFRAAAGEIFGGGEEGLKLAREVGGLYNIRPQADLSDFDECLRRLVAAKEQKAKADEMERMVNEALAMSSEIMEPAPAEPEDLPFVAAVEHEEEPVAELTVTEPVATASTFEF